MNSAEKVRFVGYDPAPPPGGRAETRARSERFWQVATFACVAVLVATAIGLAAYSIHRVNSFNQQFVLSTREVQSKLQELHAGIQFDSRRQLLLVGIRDEIMLTNSSVSLNEAYDYAQHLLAATEKYPSINPLLFLAIGTVESGFDPRATSGADAMGLYQIWPSTGRLLARALGWEYHDEMLYDPARNTEMAALYLDILLSTYHDEKMVLAEYNGGPINAGYLRAASSRVAAETRDYVHKVDTVYQRLKAKFELGIDARALEMHRDLNRDGKRLTD